MGIRLQNKLKTILADKELTVQEIAEYLKREDRRKYSFTSNSIAQTLTKKKEFVKCGFDSKRQVAIWTISGE